jgi:hypothetical protein
LVADEEPVPAGLPVAVARLGEAVGWLRRELAGAVEPEAARGRALSAMSEAARAYASGVGFSGSVVVAQVRSTAIDLVPGLGRTAPRGRTADPPRRPLTELQSGSRVSGMSLSMPGMAENPVPDATVHASSTTAREDQDDVHLRFSGEIWQWRGPAPYYFVTVPEEESRDLQTVSTAVTYGWGMIPVRVRIGGTEWSTSLWPKDGRYVVPLKDAVRTAEGLEEGDTVTVLLAIVRQQ